VIKWKQNAMQAISSRHKKMVYHLHIKHFLFSHTMVISVIANEEMHHDSYRLLQRGNDVTEFDQAENNASNHVFGKCSFSRCDNSCMGTGIRLLSGVRNEIGDKGIPLLYTKVFLRPTLASVTKTKVSKI